jgi:hypothetical protein
MWGSGFELTPNRIALLASMTLSLLGCSGSSPAARGSSLAPPPIQTCNDSVEASTAGSPPLLIPPDRGTERDVFIGSGDTWFMGTKGHRWGESVQYFRGSFFMKVGIYTLQSHPPRVTVLRTDGRSVGHAELAPTSRGLPGPLPAGLYFPTAGCWEVVAQGATGSAAIRVRVEVT